MQAFEGVGFSFPTAKLIQGRRTPQLDGRAQVPGHGHVLISPKPIPRPVGHQGPEWPQSPHYPFLGRLSLDCLTPDQTALQLGIAQLVSRPRGTHCAHCCSPRVRGPTPGRGHQDYTRPSRVVELHPPEVTGPQERICLAQLLFQVVGEVGLGKLLRPGVPVEELAHRPGAAV